MVSYGEEESRLRIRDRERRKYMDDIKEMVGEERIEEVVEEDRNR